ncbi:bifunctional diaminohydroxyphosphoribosylaminopyrimidine deaminase/5-amino-6-(5-phosphoribosylamino)uracil reductase RibD [Aestuariibacter halophilus]|uniref:Riboflavin biosynthesis protein RibD n=1 Tax=Fluctibacter halophilus TaxID=226011 RepID=A0ABS8G2B4_9ALTE|nr:bifunctional diaminohydroxyphosphoribosylaminopyrimidine deaminase/5-amino-6-(5-phosphoribosylamino)uracil reductase RibD [Aestuariibacter halophilus]MCC2614720.1 bifunctional diaminohydroxyphosphoribosylaminopyrimidine deaminase/5-amino-6-(5-phosphoribosylamino)uracil reductase RibD [Aestuariibacter halophilus]
MHADLHWMSVALRQAEKGLYTTSPNPRVGCVVVDPDGQCVGQGYHHQAGQGHAEVMALAQAGERAKGATVYVTLEPCSHTGRTPPCADALIQAGVARVVAAMEDPNPQVSGAGLTRLANAGIDVLSGVLEAQARALNPGFIKRMTQGLPWVRVKLAAGLDGRTAMANGHSQWITGNAAREDVQRYRARSCAILTGSGTVLDDNPSLNVRLDGLPTLTSGQLRQPLRAVIDRRQRLSAQIPFFSLPGNTLRFHCGELHTPWPTGVGQHRLTHNDENGLFEALQHLAGQGMNEVWIEAGAQLSGCALKNQWADELILYIAPKLMGDDGRGLMGPMGLEHMDNAFQYQWQDVRQVGDDLRLTLRPQA